MWLFLLKKHIQECQFYYFDFKKLILQTKEAKLIKNVYV